MNTGNMKNYNLLAFYDAGKNDLRFVTYKHCSLGNKNLQDIKSMKFVQNVIGNENPSNEDVAKMFLGISDEIQRIIVEIDPKPNVCHFDYYEENIDLREDEHIVSHNILRAMYVITMEGSRWESANPEGLYVSQNFMESRILDFLPVITSNKEKFVKLLKEKTNLSTREIDYYYNLVTTEGNIIMDENYDQSKLFHERVHKIIAEDVSNEERSILISSRNDLLKNEKVSDYFASFLFISVVRGSWDELYAYMAQYEKYPQSQDEDHFIDLEIYNKFSSEYSETYEIYQKIYNFADR